MQTVQVAECSEEISVDEVRECIRRLKSSKAPGVCGTTGEVLEVPPTRANDVTTSTHKCTAVTALSFGGTHNSPRHVAGVTHIERSHQSTPLPSLALSTPHSLTCNMSLCSTFNMSFFLSR